MKNIRRILSYLKDYRKDIIISLICALITVAVALLIPIFSGKAIDQMISGNTNFAIVIQELIYIGICAIVSSISQYIANRLNQDITYHLCAKLRDEAIAKIQKLPLSYLDAHPSGDILNRIIVDVDTFSDGLLQTLTQLFTGILTILGTISIMLYLNIKIGLIVIVLTPSSILISKFIAQKINIYFKKANAKRSEETAYINELIDAQKLVTTFSYEEKNKELFSNINQEYDVLNLKSVFFSTLINPSTRLMNNVVYAITGLVCCLFGLQGIITLGEISVFLSYASQYGKPFNEISGVIGELQNAINCASRTFELLDQANEVEQNNSVTLEAKGNIQFKDVSFGYGDDQLLFNNFSLSVKKGQHVAIVGPTGAGKTSLINLIMRFYDVKDGSIRFDKTNIATISRHELRNNIGMVLQDTWLKSGTIKENIAYGSKEATDEQIIEAAKKAHAHFFISRLPQGYDTIIQENGDNLSQGEKQLLCIARVMLKKSSILILDEATSSIDTRTEVLIQKAFYEMMKGKTSFIVAHRLSTIKDADIIIVMDHGDIKESGSHEELLAKHGFYYHLYHSQFED